MEDKNPEEHFKNSQLIKLTGRLPFLGALRVTLIGLFAAGPAFGIAKLIS